MQNFYIPETARQGQSPQRWPTVKTIKPPGRPGPPGTTSPGRSRGACGECGAPLAADQRYCLSCGHRRGALPGAVAATVGVLSTKGKALAAAAGAKVPKPQGEEAGWSWMPSPQAIAIAVIGMLALGVGLGSAMSEIADSAPLQTILLEYPHHAEEGPAAEEPEEEAEEAPVVAEAPEEEAAPEEFAPLPEEVVAPILPPEEEVIGGGEEEELVPFNPFEEEESELGEKALPEIKHAWLIVLGENSYENTYGAGAEAPYLTRVLPKKGELIPNYYGVTSGVLANEIALLSGQGPTTETALNCPTTPRSPRPRSPKPPHRWKAPAASIPKKWNRCRPSWKKKNWNGGPTSRTWKTAAKSASRGGAASRRSAPPTRRCRPRATSS